MSDIVERLRKYAEDWRDRAASNDVVLEAAAHIDALREEVERLREVNKITREVEAHNLQRALTAEAQLTALRQRVAVEEIGRDHAAFYERAINAVRALDDYTNTNETEFTGWGDGAVPPRATFWRVKSGQALKALGELADMALINEIKETTDGR